MEIVPITECKEGEILAEAVVNKYGTVLAFENTVMNRYIIDKLYGFGIQHLKIKSVPETVDSLNDSKTYQQIKENYKESILNIKSILNELAAGKPLNLKKATCIADTLYCGIHESCEILEVLNEEKGFDEYTYAHSLNVGLYAMLIGKWLRLGKNSIKNLIKAGVLHDIGKMKIPIEILNKTARLSDEEFKIIKQHTIYGYELARSTDCLPDEVCEAILSHHEREDQSGYPYGNGGMQFGLFTKIIAVADVYDAMTSDRVYKRRTTPFKVFEMFQTVGVKNFDPKVVKSFLTNLSAFYVGSQVLLDTGEVGEVVYIPPHSMTEPVVRIDSNYIDLAKVGERQILCML